MRTLRWHAAVLAVTVVLMVAAYAVGRSVRHSLPPPGSAWAAGAILATYELVDEAGVQKGQVKINGVPVIKFEADSGGLTAYERAMLAANRINVATTLGSTAADFTASNVEGTDCVVVGDRLVAAVDEAEATATGKTTAQVAQDWVTAIQSVLQAPPAVPATTPVLTGAATAQKITGGGVEQGQVSMGGAPVFQLTVESGGLSAYERAMLAAIRISAAVAAGAGQADFSAQTIDTTDCVIGAGQLIAAVDPAEAVGGKTTAQVAQEWTAAIQTHVPAAGTTTPATTTPGGQTGGGAGGWMEGPTTTPGATDTVQNIVPILRVGGTTQLGLAQVQGPADAVAQVQAVALISSKFKNLLELQIYVPIPATTAIEPLTRVQGVGLYAIAVNPGG